MARPVGRRRQQRGREGVRGGHRRVRQRPVVVAQPEQRPRAQHARAVGVQDVRLRPGPPPSAGDVAVTRDHWSAGADIRASAALHAVCHPRSRPPHVLPAQLRCSPLLLPILLRAAGGSFEQQVAVSSLACQARVCTRQVLLPAPRARQATPACAHRASEHGAVDGEERGAVDHAQQRLQRALHPGRQPPALLVQEARLRMPELLTRSARVPQGPRYAGVRDTAFLCMQLS